MSYCANLYSTGRDFLHVLTKTMGMGPPEDGDEDNGGGENK